MQVINVTSIFEQINGVNGCTPMQDADGRWIMDEANSSNKNFAGIWDLIDACPRIPYNPILLEE